MRTIVAVGAMAALTTVTTTATASSTAVTTASTTVATAGAAGWSAVAVGANHTCGIEQDGSLWCWGDNTYGQLGDGTMVGRSSPIEVGAGTTWATVSAGGRHTCAIDTVGQLSCWGSNTNGQLGLGDTTARLIPTRVGAASWGSVNAGGFHTCGVLLAPGSTLWCWGDNDYGQLGGGSDAVGHNQLTPRQVGHRDWRSVAVGQYHTCGVQDTKRLFCWGDNNNGQLGLGDTVNRADPSRVYVAHGPGHLPQVDAGYAHSCARGYGQLFCWGANSSGQLGIGSTDQQTAPTRVASGDNWNVVATGSAHSCGLEHGGALWCWGDDFYGQLGDGGSAVQLVPVRIGSSDGWKSITAGEDHTCGLGAKGSLWCWGFNGYGQLGDGTTIDEHQPIRVTAP